MDKKLLNEINDDIAQKLIREKKYDEAIQILEENIRSGSSYLKTFKLLIAIYRKKNDYAKLIKTIDHAIRISGNKKGFRELKKICILERMLKDMKKCET